MAKDLRTFLDDICRVDPMQLIKVQKEVSCKYDVIALPDLLEQFPALPLEFLIQAAPEYRGLGVDSQSSHRVNPPAR